MRVLDRMERDLVVGAGDAPEDGGETFGDMVAAWVTMSCIALTKGVAGGVPCDMGGRLVGGAIDNSPNVNIGNAWSCAKIGTNCDDLEDDTP